LVKFENNQAIELKEQVTGNKVPLNSVKKLIPGIEYEFVPIPDYSNEYLTFVALEDGTFKLSNNAVSYSSDNGETWVELAANTASPTVTAGNKIMWKGELTPTSSNGIGTFSATGNFDVQGNAMSLLFGDNFKGQTSLTGKKYAFYRLFYQNTKVINANNLSLPATTLAESCYSSMFDSCTSLETAPELLATTLAGGCYRSMFSGCTSLTTAPVLPATTLANNCYQNMFSGCTSLVTAPELPVTTLASNCYWGMFQDCTSLVTAPVLPAETLATSCYQSMFQGCTSLTTAPELPANTLAQYCYAYMFSGCTNLTTAPELPAETLADNCYNSMFQGCTSLTTAPSRLPATTLTQKCYYYMFSGCTGLTTAPELPATTLANDCYIRMFSDCTSLTTAPVLPATKLEASCYNYMFNRCTSLNYIKAMFTTIPSYSYTYNWVSGVASSGTFVKNSAAEWNVTGNDGIPNGWTVQTA